MWIGFEYCVDRKNTKNSDLFASLAFLIKESYKESINPVQTLFKLFSELYDF
ncbi:hypothetical protein EV05_0013 [Prochlorococcus sp. MIT 0601]|nr:hypothetical protein EV05_0013 [Prochlorococcus sp. MIT 0601]